MQSEEAGAMKCEVVVLGGDEVGSVLPLESRTLVGRSPEADIRLSGLSVSKRHCEFVIEGSGVLVSDLGSRNGTCVNGRPVQKATLSHGDIVLVGDCPLFFRSPDEAPGPPPDIEPADSARGLRTKRLTASEHERWKEKRARRTVEEEVHQVFQFLDFLDLGVIIGKGTVRHLLQEIVVSKVTLALRATRCLLMGVESGNVQRTLASRQEGGAPVPRLPEELLREVLSGDTAVVPWFHAAAEATALLTSCAGPAGSGLLYVERPSALGAYTLFERSVFVGYAAALDSVAAQETGDDTSTQEFRLPSF
jgi:hypothetical protein